MKGWNREDAMSSMLIVKETIDNDFGGWAIAGQILKGLPKTP